MTNDQSEKRDDRLRFYHKPDNLHESLRELGRLAKLAGLPFYQSGGKLFEIKRINYFDGDHYERLREVTAGQFGIVASSKICWMEERNGEFRPTEYDRRIVRFFLQQGQRFWDFADLGEEQARRKGAIK